MVDVDPLMLAVGLAVVWGGIVVYVARLALLTGRLEREVRSLRGLVARDRQEDRSSEPGTGAGPSTSDEDE